MDINQINGKTPENVKTPNFEIVVKTYHERALKEGSAPEESYPGGGYMILVDQGDSILVKHCGELSFDQIAMALLEHPKLGILLKLFALMG